MKIYITGGPGSGKSFLSEKLKNKFKINKLELDEIVWDKNYNKLSSEIRDKNLDIFLSNNKDWIIEGTYFDWLHKLFLECNLIVFLQINVFIRDYRIIKRFLINKLNKKIIKEEGFKNLVHMLIWNHHYEKEIKKQFFDFTKNFKTKVAIVKDVNKIDKLISSKITPCYVYGCKRRKGFATPSRGVLLMMKVRLYATSCFESLEKGLQTPSRGERNTKFRNERVGGGIP